MPADGANLTRDELIKVAKERKGSVKNYATYIPTSGSVEKLNKWAKEAEIIYLTSRRKPEEIEIIRNVLEKHNFPKGELIFRQENEAYKDAAERVMPDILIEDDCECIGGEPEMVYPHMREDLKPKIKSIVIKEFVGLYDLPDELTLN